MSLIGEKSLGYTELRARITKILAFFTFILELLEVKFPSEIRGTSRERIEEDLLKILVLRLILL